MDKQQFECFTLSPLDGRYAGIKDALGEYFSEYALVKYRVFVEIQWLKFLIENVESDVLSKFNKDKLAADLNEKWEVLAEPIQTMLRKYGISDAYDQLKELTRGKNISQEAIMEFAKGLDVLSDEDRQTLLDMTPASYIGYASNLCDIDL